MFRSILAMVLLGVTSIGEWVAFLRSFPSFPIISGFLPRDTPGALTFYDFFDRLYLMEKSIAKGKARLEGKPRKHKINPQQLPNEADPERDHKRVNKDW